MLFTDVFILSKDLTGFNRLYDPVYKLEALTANSFDNSFVGKVNVTLIIRCFFCFTCQGCGNFNKCLESFC